VDAGDACEYSVLPLCCSPGLFRVWASIGGSVTSDTVSAISYQHAAQDTPRDDPAKKGRDLLLLVLCEDVNDQFPESLDPSTIDAPLRPARLPIGGRVWLEGPSDGRREESHGVGLIVAIMSDSCKAAEPTTMEGGMRPPGGGGGGSGDGFDGIYGQDELATRAESFRFGGRRRGRRRETGEP